MPLETEDTGPIAPPLAQRISADCANLAADVAFGATTPTSPLGLACESFKKTFAATLNRAVVGSRVRTLCLETTTPVIAP